MFLKIKELLYPSDLACRTNGLVINLLSCVSGEKADRWVCIYVLQRHNDGA